MKRLFISVAAILCMAATASAQTLIVVEEKPVLTNKKGAPILPQAGDVSIGISTTPFFSYLGNMFTRDGSNTAPTFNSLGAGLNMKFFTADNQAIRAGLNVNFGTDYYYGNPTSNTVAGATVTDRMEKSNQGFGINIGYEWRRGYGRLQGFYGAQLAASYNNVTTHYKYGNEMNATYPTPWSWDFNTGSQAQMAERMIDVKGAPIISVGLFGFVGVEYFFAPKMSIGGEIGLGVAYVNQGESEYTGQYFDTASNSVKENTVKRHDSTTPTNGFNVRTAAQGNIFLSFYF